MDERSFAELVGRTWDQMPGRFKTRVVNVALLIEDEPSPIVRGEEHLAPGETLLGLYHGVPASARGEGYGIGGTLPDTITLYRLPLLEEAHELMRDRPEFTTLAGALEEVVRQTLWHEVGHYFGLSEHEIDAREGEGTNTFKS